MLVSAARKELDGSGTAKRGIWLARSRSSLGESRVNDTYGLKHVGLAWLPGGWHRGGDFSQEDGKAGSLLGYLAASMTESSQSLLLEIGAEELPSSFVDGALAALPGIVADELAKVRLSHADVHALGTPRRLAVKVHGVAIQQLDLDEEVVGPPEAIAFKDGKATKAAEAFATKLAAPLDSLVVVEKAAGPKQKAGRYVVGRRIEAGRRAMDLLGSVLVSVCAAIPFRKSMRWGNLDTS